MEGSWSGSPGHYCAATSSRKHYIGLALLRDAVGGAHLWRDRALKDPDLFMSDALHGAIAEAGLKVWPQYRLKEV